MGCASFTSVEAAPVELAYVVGIQSHIVFGALVVVP